MSGTLYVVATPIGNLEDITLRALRVLREVDLIAAEDTRRTARLLAHHGISTPTISFHEHNSRSRTPQLLDKLGRGASVAVVTDAGTPGVSDPGVELVAAAVSTGITVDPVPGVSAPLTAAIASGFPMTPLTFMGFVPSRAKDRTEFVKGVAAVSGTVTFFEAPHRIAATLGVMSLVLGDRPIVVARELTKVHQEFLRGTSAMLAERLGEPKGEFTIVVGPSVEVPEAIELPSDTQLASEFGEIAKSGGMGRRDAIVTIAKKYGTSTREVYAAVERGKRVGQTT
jgi:16S rRNA (cytidine1402-2'-O)-methyltransferase